MGWFGGGLVLLPDKERSKRQNFFVFVVWEQLVTWSVQVLRDSSRDSCVISRFKSGREGSLWSNSLSRSRLEIRRRSSGDSPGLHSLLKPVGIVLLDVLFIIFVKVFTPAVVDVGSAAVEKRCSVLARKESQSASRKLV